MLISHINMAIKCARIYKKTEQATINHLKRNEFLSHLFYSAVPECVQIFELLVFTLVLNCDNIKKYYFSLSDV